MPNWFWPALGLVFMAAICGRAILARRQEKSRADRGRWTSWAGEGWTSSANDTSDVD